MTATKYRYVLSTPVGEFFSEPQTQTPSMEDIRVRSESAVGRWLNRAEVNDGSGWRVL